MSRARNTKWRLRIVSHPEAEFFKDEGGKNHALETTVRLEPLGSHGLPSQFAAGDAVVPLRLTLYYESEKRVEDADQDILHPMATDPKEMWIRADDLMCDVRFRIEKVSRRKDGQRFKVLIEVDEEDASCLPEFRGIVGALTTPICVMSKRKSHAATRGRKRRHPGAAEDGSVADTEVLRRMDELQTAVDGIESMLQEQSSLISDIYRLIQNPAMLRALLGASANVGGRDFGANGVGATSLGASSAAARHSSADSAAGITLGLMGPSPPMSTRRGASESVMGGSGIGSAITAGAAAETYGLRPRGSRHAYGAGAATGTSDSAAASVSAVDTGASSGGQHGSTLHSLARLADEMSPASRMSYSLPSMSPTYALGHPSAGSYHRSEGLELESKDGSALAAQLGLVGEPDDEVLSAARALSRGPSPAASPRSSVGSNGASLRGGNRTTSAVATASTAAAAAAATAATVVAPAGSSGNGSGIGRGRRRSTRSTRGRHSSIPGAAVGSSVSTKEELQMGAGSADGAADDGFAVPLSRRTVSGSSQRSSSSQASAGAAGQLIAGVLASRSDATAAGVLQTSLVAMPAASTAASGAPDHAPTTAPPDVRHGLHLREPSMPAPPQSVQFEFGPPSPLEGGE